MWSRLSSLLFVFCFLAASAPKREKLPPRYDQWLNQEAVYVITDEEKKEFFKLTSDEDRDRFITQFWEIRNPRRGTETNPYKEEHYRRIQYANEHFGRQSGTPGWMTDQGRAYIELGAPTSMHKFTGYSQIRPLDLWFYQNNTGLPSLPPFFYLLFYIPEDIGEYKFYRPALDGPMKLAAGSRVNSNRDVYKLLQPLGGDVSRSMLSLEPGDPIDTETYEPTMTSDLLVNRIVNLANDSFNLEKIRSLRALRARVTSYLLLADEHPLQVETLTLADPLGNYWLDYAVLIDNPMLGMPDDAQTELKTNIAYRLLSSRGSVIVEDSEERRYPAYVKGESGKVFTPFQVANRLPILPGEYTLAIDITNKEQQKTFHVEKRVLVGKLDVPAVLGPLVVGGIDRAERPSSLVPFQYFGVQFRPSTQQQVRQSDGLRVLYQLNLGPLAAGAQQVDYSLINLIDRTQRRTVSDTIAASEFKDGRLLKSKTIPLQDLADGEYRLAISLKAPESAQTAASVSIPVRVDRSRDPGATPLYIANSNSTLGTPGLVEYICGLEASAQGSDALAANYLRRAMDRNPTIGTAGLEVVQMYFKSKRFQDVAELYRHFGISPFRASVEVLTQISLSLWNAGDKTQATEVLTAAREYFPNHPLLNAASKRLRAP